MLANFVAVQFLLMRKPRTVEELHKLTGASKSAVTRYVLLMVEEGMLEPCDTAGRRKSYRWVDLTLR